MSRRAIFASDIRSLGGVVSIVAGRDRVTGEECFRVDHVSRGGDIAWTSRPVMDEKCAVEAARVLAEFVGATIRR